jgi:hypothetical protein
MTTKREGRQGRARSSSLPLRLKSLQRLDGAMRRAFEIDRDLCGVAERSAKLARPKRDNLIRSVPQQGTIASTSEDHCSRKIRDQLVAVQ